MTTRSRRLAVVITLILLPIGTANVWAQSGGLQSGGVGYRSPSSGSLYYLRLPQVEKELELSDEQRKQIKELRESTNDEMRTAYSELRELPREERMKKYYEQLGELSGDVDKRLEGILLAHQLDRLKQVSVQLSLRYRGTAYALAQSELAEVLGITEKQLVKLREKREETNKKLQQEYQRLRQEAQRELLEDVLTRKQFRKLKELMGDELTFP